MNEPLCQAPQCGDASCVPPATPASSSGSRLPFPPEVVNPFIDNVAARSTILQRTKMILLGIVLLPIRFTLFMFCLLLACAAAHLSLAGYTDEKLTHAPMKEGVGKKLTYVFARCCMFFLGYQWLESDTSNYSLRPDGSRKRANIVVLNHSTVCDGFLLFYVHGLMSIGVNSLADAPIFGTFAKCAQAFSLDRDNAECRKRIGAEMVRRVTWTAEQERELGQWHPFTVFVEGTCTNQKALIQFRHGAFLPGVAVQPMLVRYPFVYNDQSWCGLSSPLSSVMRLMCQFHNRLEYWYLPVYEPSDEEKRDPFLYASNVRAVMAKALHVPCTEHTFEDMKVATAAQKLGLPWREIHCEMGYFRSHGSSYERAKAIVARFAEADTNKDGYLSRDELRAYLKLDGVHRCVTDAIFFLWNNATSENKVSFRHFYFMTGLRQVKSASTATTATGNATPTDSSASPVTTSIGPCFLYDGCSDVQRACAHDQIFRAFDVDCDDRIGREEFRRVMRVALPSMNEGSRCEAEALDCLFDSVDRASPQHWTRDHLETFLAAHPGMAEHFLATIL